MYYDRTCGTLRCAWLERSRVSFSSSRRCAFAFSRLRFQGVRHDPVSESLRVLRRGLARRFMTRHHPPFAAADSSSVPPPPAIRIELSRDRRRAERPANRSSARDRACARSETLVRVDVDRRGPSGGRRPPLRPPPLGRQDRPPLGPPPLGRQDRPPLGPPPLGRQDPRRRAPRAPADLGRLDRVGDGSRYVSLAALLAPSCPGAGLGADAGRTPGRRFAEGERWPTPARADSPGR